MLRHTGSGEKEGHMRITDDASWATTGDISRTAKASKKRPRLAPMTININTMLGIVLDDDKGRFQLGVLVAVPDAGAHESTDLTQKLRVHTIHAMRAVNSHSLRIDQSKIACPVKAEHFELMSAITHKTQSRHLPRIIKYGILPGGIYVAPGAPRGTGDRLTTNLCAFLPTDPRNV
eukprot:14060286-Heterocapsa_arctica.AAC.1